MFGFVFGTICLIGLFATLRRRAMWSYAYGMGYGGYRSAFYGYPPWARHRHGHGYGRGYSPRSFWLRSVFEQLDTTPGQEKAIVKSIDGLTDHMASSRRELGEVRKEVAQALGGDVLDESVLTAALERVEDLIAKTKLELVQALTAIHASLDGKQRRELAELISDGLPRGGHYGFSRF
jgi:Spy/CpxP family protein refolding chaperone